jgi:hypothetical protein
LVTRSGLFTGTVTTDGVTVNPHFRAQDAEELQAIKDAKDASAKAREGGLHGSHARTPKKQSEG